MNSLNALKYGFLLILYVGIQVLFLKNMVLFNMAFPFLYISFLLILPIETNNLLLMLIGLITGFFVDLFYDTLGIHMAACVLVTYLRPGYLKLLSPQGGYDVRAVPSIRDMGLQWFVIYASFFILVLNLAIFFLEAGGFKMFFFTLSKAFFSSFFTLILVLLTQYIFYSPARAR